MADHWKLRHVMCKAGTGLVLHVSILVTFNSSVNADRTLMIIKHNAQICHRKSRTLNAPAQLYIIKMAQAESVSYFSAYNLLTTLVGGGLALDDVQCAAQKPLVMMVSFSVAAQLGLTQPVQ